MAGAFEPDRLRSDLAFMQEGSLEIIHSLSEGDLHKALEPLKDPHPVAKTKFEAIDWNIKHTMWHCGQMASWKRMVDQPYDYGLKDAAKKGSFGWARWPF